MCTIYNLEIANNSIAFMPGRELCEASVFNLLSSGKLFSGQELTVTSDVNRLLYSTENRIRLCRLFLAHKDRYTQPWHSENQSQIYHDMEPM